MISTPSYLHSKRNKHQVTDAHLATGMYAHQRADAYKTSPHQISAEKPARSPKMHSGACQSHVPAHVALAVNEHLRDLPTSVHPAQHSFLISGLHEVSTNGLAHDMHHSVLSQHPTDVASHISFRQHHATQ